MVIELMPTKYAVNCGRGMSIIEHTGILGKLNKIIEWDLCKNLPDSVDKVLVPGSTFMIAGSVQVLAVYSEIGRAHV